jgi:hypothetical protein
MQYNFRIILYKTLLDIMAYTITEVKNNSRNPPPNWCDTGNVVVIPDMRKQNYGILLMQVQLQDV